MFTKSGDIVKVATGTLIEMQDLEGVLQGAGITCRVVGDELTTGLGTALPGSVELWVPAAEADQATTILHHHASHGHHDTHKHPKFGHPVSDAKPDNRDRGPQHGAPPHRPVS